MAIGNWPASFMQRMGGSLPDDYFCFDTETTGFSRDKDVIVEWGHVLIRDRKPANKINLVINWLASDLVPHQFIIDKLAKVKRGMALHGKHYRITPQVMEEEGVEPEKALPFIYDMCRQIQDNNELFVAHNGWNYDATMVYNHFESFGVGDFAWRDDDMFDTGAVIKALALVDNPKSYPRPDESLRAYFKRIIAWRVKGLKWGLDGPAVAGMNLEEFGVDPNLMHTAGNDALAVHGLMERIRQHQKTTPNAKKSRTKPGTSTTKRRRRGQRNR